MRWDLNMKSVWGAERESDKKNKFSDLKRSGSVASIGSYNECIHWGWWCFVSVIIMTRWCFCCGQQGYKVTYDPQKRFRGRINYGARKSKNILGQRNIGSRAYIKRSTKRANNRAFSGS